MIITDKFIFVRVPRTASSSIEEFLKDYHDKKYNELCGFSSIRLSHMTIKDLSKINSNILDQKIKFAFVRNPFDRLVSYYHYYSNKSKNFKEFILNYLLSGKKLSKNLWFDQSHWLVNTSNKIIVDYIGRFENLEEDFKKVCNIIDIPYKSLPWLKKSKDRTHYSKFYDNELIKIVENKCKKDLELFNYKYN